MEKIFDDTDDRSCNKWSPVGVLGHAHDFLFALFAEIGKKEKLKIVGDILS